ncbi:MAG: glycosyltransferase, partial [bacterium]|nr:glycosyltransferase [bacterium]
FPAAAPYFDREKVRATGLPLRENIARAGQRSADFWSGPLRVLIFGGSQGAHAINQAVMEALPLLGDLIGRLRFVHQTGEADFEAVRAAYESAGAEAEVAPFFYDMPERYGWAHLAISRAGAMTVGELGASALPAVLIPLPTATHGHQEGNARYLVELGAARMILQPVLTAGAMAGQLRELEADRGALAEMARRAGEVAAGDASGAVAGLCHEVAWAA